MTRPIRLVRDLWSADQMERLDAILAAADDAVVWQPHLMGGRVVFRSTTELRRALGELAASGLRYVPRLESVEEHDGVVIAAGTLRTMRDGAVDERLVHASYHFRDGRLTRQAPHASREDALDSLTALRVVTTATGPLESAGADGERIVRISGELDIANAAELEAALVRPRPRGERVALDLARLHFMDSTGLRAVMRACAAARAAGWELTLRNVHPNVARLFELAGVTATLPIEPHD